MTAFEQVGQLFADKSNQVAVVKCCWHCRQALRCGLQHK
jgi:hypothetical protein